MAPPTLLIEQPVQLDNGLIIPASAAAGKMLVSDGSGNAAWADPGDEDILQSGVLGNVASTGITATISSSTRVPTWSQWPTGDVIWFTVSGIMIRSTMPAGPTAAFDAPGSGKWRYVAIDAVPPATFGGACTYVESSSADQTSAALASAAPTAVTAGNIRVWDGIITNTAGSYSLVSGGTGINTIPAATGRDRRPWAKGSDGSATPTTSGPTLATVSTDTVLAEMSLRMECSGVSVEFVANADVQHSVANDWVRIGIWQDGALLTSYRTMVCPVANQPMSLTGNWTVTPAAGSHLFQVVWATQAATATNVTTRRSFTVREKFALANNGTA